MEGPQTAPDRRQDFKRNAPNSASIDLFVCLPQPANLRIPHTSTTDHIPTLRADSFQSGNCDSGLTVLRLREEKAHLARPLVISVIAICVFDASVQLVGSAGLPN